ncbi:MAG TPA: hypothetical protein VM779_00735 [Thermoanaerobaculia bacterium]|nr:hypothetical protein [Thermoanaerobaculia bacterium]
MNSILATEPTEGQNEPARPLPRMQESWVSNERMRHVPSVDWIVWKVDSDLRRKINRVLTPFLALRSDDGRRPRMELELRNLCRALDRLADVARHTRHNGQPADIAHRVEGAMNQAVSCLRSLDGNLIGRRFPFQTFERSKAEPLYGALLAVMQVVENLVSLARELDPDLDERLLEGTVVLQNPVDERMLRPIA